MQKLNIIRIASLRPCLSDRRTYPGNRQLHLPCPQRQSGGGRSASRTLAQEAGLKRIGCSETDLDGVPGY